jgi:hypothetical protein
MDINLFFNICDFLAATTTVVGLVMIPKNYRWWIVYTISNIFYVVVTIKAKMTCLTILGFVLFFIGVKNYLDARKLDKQELKCKNCFRVLPSVDFTVDGKCCWCKK